MAARNNINTLSARLLALSAAFETEVKEIVAVTLGDMEQEAYRNAPGGGDRIQTQGGSISPNQIAEKRKGTNNGNIAAAIGNQIEASGLKGSVYVEKSAGDIAVYVEMGTGQSAKSYLLTVPPEWRAVAQKFYINGRGTIIAKPYLLPAFNKYSVVFVKELDAAMKKLKI